MQEYTRVLKLVEFGVLKVHTNSGDTKHKWTTSTSQYQIVLLRGTRSTTGTSTDYYKYQNLLLDITTYGGFLQELTQKILVH